MAITKVYNVACDRCEERYPDSHPEEDILTLWVRLHDAGWRQAPSDGELPSLVVCPKCAAWEGSSDSADLEGVETIVSTGHIDMLKGTPCPAIESGGSER